MTLLEGVLSGAETDVEYVLRSIHEFLVTSISIGPSDVLVLAFEMLQIAMRLLLKLSLEILKRKSITGAVSSASLSYFIPPEVLSKLPLNCSSIKLPTIQKLSLTVCEAVYETVLDACLGLLSHMDYTVIVRRSLGMLSEVISLCLGIKLF